MSKLLDDYEDMHMRDLELEETIKLQGFMTFAGKPKLMFSSNKHLCLIPLSAGFDTVRVTIQGMKGRLPDIIYSIDSSCPVDLLVNDGSKPRSSQAGSSRD